MSNRYSREPRWMEPAEDLFDEERFPKPARPDSYWRPDESPHLGKAPPQPIPRMDEDGPLPGAPSWLTVPNEFGPPILSVPQVRSPKEALWRFVGKIVIRVVGKALTYALCVFFDTQPLGTSRDEQGHSGPGDQLRVPTKPKD